MIDFLKSIRDSRHFDKILLAVLFLAVTVLCIHLMHKSDAGGDDAGFIVWAETSASLILGCLLGLIKGESSQNDPNKPKLTQTNPNEETKTQ